MTFYLRMKILPLLAPSLLKALTILNLGHILMVLLRRQDVEEEPYFT